jgi:hypothetical protein
LESLLASWSLMADVWDGKISTSAQAFHSPITWRNLAYAKKQCTVHMERAGTSAKQSRGCVIIVDAIGLSLTPKLHHFYRELLLRCRPRKLLPVQCFIFHLGLPPSLVPWKLHHSNLPHKPRLLATMTLGSRFDAMTLMLDTPLQTSQAQPHRPFIGSRAWQLAGPGRRRM